MGNNISLKLFKSKAGDMITKKRLNNYYLRKSAKGKTYLAILFDAVFVKIIVLTGLFIFFFIRTLDLLFSSIITIQFLILYLIISYKINKVRLKSNIDKVNEEVVKKKVYKDLINKTPIEFVETIKCNLEKLDFAKLDIVSQRDLDLVGELRGKKTGIRCFQFSKDYNVGTNIIREFFLTLRQHELEQGVIITTSSFSEDVKDFLPKLKDHIDIHVIDLNRIIKIMKKAETYPSNKEIDKIILNQIAEKRKKLIEYGNTVVSKKKFAKYLIIATLILFFGRITPYKLYYQIIAVILYILGLISAGNYVLNLLKSNTKDKTEEIF